MGRRVFDVGVGPWGDNPTCHAPCFIVTHRPAETLLKDGGTTCTFVTAGIERALEQARAAARGKTVMVMGGASVVDLFIAAGAGRRARDPPRSVLLGTGTRLFEHAGTEDLEQTEVIEGPDATHLRFRRGDRMGVEIAGRRSS
jgi:dihydrofolate reductase